MLNTSVNLGLVVCLPLHLGHRQHGTLMDLQSDAVSEAMGHQIAVASFGQHRPGRPVHIPSGRTTRASPQGCGSGLKHRLVPFSDLRGRLGATMKVRVMSAW